MKRRTALGLSLAVPSATLLTASPASAHAPGLRVVGLRVNGRGDQPLGLDAPNPVLSWRFAETTSAAADRQTAYQIRVHDGSRLLWDSGRVTSAVQSGVRYGGKALTSRQRVTWQVRAWDANRHATDWSRPSTWENGLLEQSDWGGARWIEYPGRTETQPMPIFARQFRTDPHRKVIRARLYLSGVGLHLATVNGRSLTDEVLAPGYSNYQLSSEYRVYDITSSVKQGSNTVGVRLGNGPAYVRRSVTNPAVGRTAPYAWWQSQLKGTGTLSGAVEAGATTVTLSSVTGYHVGGTLNVDTGDGGDNLESRVITAIGADSITVTPGLSKPHAAGVTVTGSGNNIAASDASAGAAVTPRFIARLEIAYAGGKETVIVSDREWRAALGPLITDAWYSGSDHDARREQPGWDQPKSDLSAAAKRRDGTAMGWIAAGIAPPPNLATRLVGRTAPPITVAETFKPVAVTNPVPGTWVFDFGQNIVGLPQLRVTGLPAGTTIRISPAESLAADGTVDQASLKGGGGSRGVDLFNTYTTAGLRGGETWRPDFNYFGMQWVQVSGLPSSFVPAPDLVTGLRVQADTPVAGAVTTSNARVNRIHEMAWYSFAGNIQSVFTDCPGREKLSYPADYTMPMGSIHRNFDLSAYLRTHEHHLVEGQSIADTPMAGNVALKTPVYDWGYTGRFGDEINWGNAIILVPGFLRQLYGDVSTAERYYPQMVAFADYIARQKAAGHIVDAALADWVSAEPVSGRITGTWGYYTMISSLAALASDLGRSADARKYSELSAEIAAAFHNTFWDPARRLYADNGAVSQTAQALALDAGLVPDAERQVVLDGLIAMIYAFHPNGDGPHFSGGTIGMAPTVRALSAGGRDDVLWDLIQEDEQPSYGYFMESTVANPGGMTTMGERWNRGDSKNHMILAQIEEWFHAGLAGIRAAEGTVAYRELVIQPKVVGDLTFVRGSYVTPQGTARSEWKRDGNRLKLTATIPPNTTAQVWVPTLGGRVARTPRRATFLRLDGGYAVYQVPSGTYHW
ncbi:alpha-L-rhamnosidase [Actinoplanes lutulentus]|uniref:alpha-L-rhamnosidase n=1 Tax=Actinoplanes lutulentus TaxID=1287878 RepID=A0A327ZIK9_9ACTN|nr:alpha-L-rhamnosidase [Actinoplanes lutulentus]MBB2947243.1 alpha-L-rhamnosidase [Actinoplanes lutulentus]RAK36518.1 alpha-L-rhamnosidase [Actinoplanes lutulentus]